MLQIVICDDEIEICNNLELRIKGILDKHQIEAKFELISNASDLPLLFEKQSIDLLYLDIDMPNISGMQLAQQLNLADQKTIFAFVTNQDALVYESFQCHPFAFLRKSHLDEELEITTISMIEEQKRRQDTYVVRCNGAVCRIAINSILYCEAEANYVKIVTTNQEYKIRKTMSEVEESLKNHEMMRIHKGFLVNQQYIHKILTDEIELTNGILLPIGRSSKELVRQQVMRYLRQ